MPRFVATEQDTGRRADIVVHDHFSEVSRSFIHKLFENGQVTLKNQPVKASYLVRHKDKLEVDYDFIARKTVPKIKLPIIYEDEDCLVIDKPAGVLTHSKGSFNNEATVGSFIISHTPRLTAEREGIVHRLDRGTSGVLIAAKTKEAQAWLQKQFSERKTDKRYMAVISGQLAEPAGTIDAPIERNPKRPQTFRVVPNGKTAQTGFQVLKEHGRFTLLELHPATGRTHQLRVHLAFLNKPIVGDTVYGGEEAERLFLHATSLGIELPNHKKETFTSSLPESFEKLMELK